MDLRPGWWKASDVWLPALLAVVIVVELVARDARPAAVAAGLVAGLALAGRRRLPVPSFVLVLAGLSAMLLLAPDMDGESLAFIPIYFIAHYSLGRWTDGLEAWVGAACVVASMVAFALGDAADNDVPISEVSLGDVAFTAGFVGGPWAAGLAMRLRREREEQLDAENRQLQADQEERARRAVAEERARIARELHDVVSHAISVTVLQARGARRTLGHDEAQVREALDAIEHTNTQALGDMRRLLAVLRDTDAGQPAGPQPSLARLDALLDDVRRSGLPVELVTGGEPREIPPGVDLSAYRIVQEALTNVIKHAGASRAAVRLDHEPDALVVSVTDDGTGGDAGRVDGGGHGLIGIRERVAVVGGEVTAGPRPGGGFEVRAWLPYSVEAP